MLGNLHLKQGDYAKATAAFQKQSKRNSVSLTSLGFAYARAGRRSEAEVLLQELAELREERYLSPALVAGIYAGLGQKDEAFARLEEAFRLRSRYPGVAQGRARVRAAPFRSEISGTPCPHRTLLSVSTHLLPLPRFLARIMQEIRIRVDWGPEKMP